MKEVFHIYLKTYFIRMDNDLCKNNKCIFNPVCSGTCSYAFLFTDKDLPIQCQLIQANYLYQAELKRNFFDDIFIFI